METLVVELDDPRAWRAAVEAVHTFIPEGVFHFTEEGVHLSAMDPSQIVYMEMNAPRSVFSTYRVSAPDIPVPLDLSEYTKILSRVSQGDRLRMALRDVDLHVRIEGAGGRVVREFRLSLLDVKETPVNVSVPEGSVEVKLPARSLKDALKDAALFSNSVLLRYDGEVFVVEAKGSSGFSRTVIRAGFEKGEERASRYSLPFLQNILRHAEPESEVIVRFSSDAPLYISYSLSGIRLSFFLAHMIL